LTLATVFSAVPLVIVDQKQTDTTDPQKPKADDKAYNAALKGLPDKPKPDPWQGTR
jgi:hypothetical protein